MPSPTTTGPSWATRSSCQRTPPRSPLSRSSPAGAMRVATRPSSPTRCVVLQSQGLHVHCAVSFILHFRSVRLPCCFVCSSLSVCVCTVLFRSFFAFHPFPSLKPVLNWANVCSPNILRTVRQTMICFLIELFVCRSWFRQFDELYFVLKLACNELQARPELAADTQQTA